MKSFYSLFRRIRGDGKKEPADDAESVKAKALDAIVEQTTRQKELDRSFEKLFGLMSETLIELHEERPLIEDKSTEVLHTDVPTVRVSKKKGIAG